MTRLAKQGATGLTALVIAFVLTAALASTAAAKGKSTKTEAEWIKFDPEAKTVTAKVKVPGRGKDAKMLKRNQEAVFAVMPEGSVLTRTTVSINGQRGELSDIPAGEMVIIYWRPDEDDPKLPRARKIDVVLNDILSDE
jgi:hypothetical protein